MYGLVTPRLTLIITYIKVLNAKRIELETIQKMSHVCKSTRTRLTVKTEATSNVNGTMKDDH